jgi:hypothetical protein
VLDVGRVARVGLGVDDVDDGGDLGDGQVEGLDVKVAARQVPDDKVAQGAALPFREDEDSAVRGPERSARKRRRDGLARRGVVERVVRVQTLEGKVDDRRLARPCPAISFLSRRPKASSRLGWRRTRARPSER